MAKVHRSWLLVAALCLQFTAARSQVEPIDEQLVALLPGRSIGLLTLDLEKCLRDGPKLGLARLLADEEVSAFLAPAFRAMRESEDFRPLLAFRDHLLESGLLDQLAGPIHLGLPGVSIGVDGKPLSFFDASSPAEESALNFNQSVAINPSLMLLVRVRDDAAAEAAFERLLSHASGLRREDREEDGTAYHYVARAEGGEAVAFAYAFTDGLFILAQNPRRLVDCARRWEQQKEDRTGSLLDDPAFAGWKRRFVDDETVFSMFLSIENWNAAMPSFELESEPALARFGYAARLRGEEIEDSLALFWGAKDWRAQVPISFLGPADFGVFGPAADDAAVRLQVSLDPGVVTSAATRMAGSKSGAFPVEEIAKTLDGRIDVQAALPAAGLIPEVFGSALVTEGEAGAALLARAAEAFGKDAGTFELGDRTAYFLRLEGFVNPAASAASDALVFASSPAVLRKRWAEMVGAGGGDAGGESAEAGVVLRLEADLPRIAEWGLTAAQPLLAMALSRSTLPLDPALMPLPDTVASYLTPLRARLAMEEEMLVFESAPPIGLALLAGVLGAAVTLSPSGVSFEEGGPPVGSEAPDIEGIDLDGKPFRLSHYRGTVIMLDFWGHW